MSSFAERLGLREVRSVIQTDTLDADTRVELWNVTNTFRRILYDAMRDHYEPTHDHVTAAIWAWEFRSPADEQPQDAALWNMIKQRIIKAAWFDALDVIEALVKYADRYKQARTSGLPTAIAAAYNDRFESYLVGYRFIGLELTPIETSGQATAVSEAIDDTKNISGARHHLQRAVDLLADRQTPDYPNSIKESISAVEAVCVAVTGEATLGAALKKLKGAGVSIHPALEGAWSKMYGWTSDASGIRHGAIEAPDADQALAKYMLVTCSAFVSHIIEVGRKAKLL